MCTRNGPTDDHAFSIFVPAVLRKKCHDLAIGHLLHGRVGKTGKRATSSIRVTEPPKRGLDTGVQTFSPVCCHKKRKFLSSSYGTHSSSSFIADFCRVYTSALVIFPSCRTALRAVHAAYSMRTCICQHTFDGAQWIWLTPRVRSDETILGVRGTRHRGLTVRPFLVYCSFPYGATLKM